jgi:hypothetical protein
LRRKTVKGPEHSVTTCVWFGRLMARSDFVSRRSERFVTLPQIERLLNATSGPGGPCDVLDTPAMAARRDVVSAGVVRREQQRKSAAKKFPDVTV